MIAVAHVLDELQKQLAKAKNSSDEQEIRESLAAMQSLCGLVLGAKDAAGSPSPVIRPPAAAPSVPAVPVSSPMEGKLLEEEDANGGSLFDF
ncbi:hypothetical protein NCCP2716_15930 [Sporosarcina sp. NCCP-2716]|uniref:YwdI family protein n=1 Tax=Sporosarcina sp. NCCP-2716 TaxID=2943679 RepID=UPI002041614A|nr:YwdI family protein [Sporosarcina sp. NCCP-2716]GKV69095.1 hypothetical protein NCCP2716_15930 [Sporosarcina sp. NCCP-2716]